MPEGDNLQLVRAEEFYHKRTVAGNTYLWSRQPVTLFEGLDHLLVRPVPIGPLSEAQHLPAEDAERPNVRGAREAAEGERLKCSPPDRHFAVRLAHVRLLLLQRLFAANELVARHLLGQVQQLADRLAVAAKWRRGLARRAARRSRLVCVEAAGRRRRQLAEQVVLAQPVASERG